MPKYKEKSKRFVVDKILERVPERIPEEILSRQISDILFERDYNTIAKTLTEYRKAERKKKGVICKDVDELLSKLHEKGVL